MSRNFDVPEQDQAEYERVANLLGFPDFEEWVTCENPYNPDIPLKAMLIRDSGDSYHERKELSQSQFGKFVDEPEVFAEEFLGEPDPDAEEPEYFSFGKQVEHYLFHDEVPGNPLVIPNEKMSRRKRPQKWFDEHQVEYDEANDDHHVFAKSGNAYKEFCAANSGRKILTQKEFDELIEPLEKIRKNIREHSKAKALLYGPSLRHVAIVFTCPFTGILLRCQLDIISEQGVIVDYKTGKTNTAWFFAADFYKFQYHFQATWYQEAVRQITGGDVLPVVYVVSEKTSKEYIVECFEIDQEWFEVALFEWQRELVHFKKCVETQVWKRRTHDTVVNLKPPIYVSRQYQVDKDGAAS